MTFKTKSTFILLVLFAPFISLCQTTENKNQSTDKQEVYENDFFRNTFYTWTTKEQIDELRKNKTLLTKSKSETNGYSLYDIRLRDSAFKNNPLAQVLQEEQFAKKRFAWTNAWATIMGWKGETYGNQLIKIVLSDSAIIVKFDAFNILEPFSAIDIKGQKLTTNYVLQNKNRIAAIYHINYQKGNREVWWHEGTFGKLEKKTEEGNIPFREFVIVNENMIEKWSYGTLEIKNEIKSEINLLKEFQKSKDANQNAYNGWQEGWDNLRTEEENSTLKYRSLKCFENNYYLFNRQRLQGIINMLQPALKQQTTEITR